jgi:ubiquitin
LNVGKPKNPKKKRKDTDQNGGEAAKPEKMSKQKRDKLKELDQYIDDVLQEAGDDFLDRFRQVEGE